MVFLLLCSMCDSPYFKHVKGNWMPFPCGRCPPCKKRRVDGWVFRLQQEERRHRFSHFLTLTYGNDTVPISGNGYLTLDKTAVPRFFKRLRKLTSNRLCYYAVGEYGSKRKRPHYHLIVFGCPDPELFYRAWHLDGSPIGEVHVGQVSGDSIAYTMKYIDKQGFIRKHGRDDREPEFSLMSKGLGSNYVTPAVVKYHNADLARNFLSKDGGFRIAMPRYYRDRIFDDDAKSEQHGIIDLSLGKKRSDNYKEYVRLYGHVEDFSFEQFCETQRMARKNRFYSNQKDREL